MQVSKELKIKLQATLKTNRAHGKESSVSPVSCD